MSGQPALKLTAIHTFMLNIILISFSLKMYNLCKTISIGTYTFTFDFYIHGPALIVKFLFKNTNPIQRISIEFNTSSFLLSYVDRLIGIEETEN